MAVTYQKVPVTLDPQNPIPEGAMPSAGLDDEDAAIVADVSGTFAAETAVDLSVAVVGRDAQFAITPATEFEDGFTVDWDFGNGRRELADDLEQNVSYAADGFYDVTAVVAQPHQPSFALHIGVAIGLDEA